MYFHFRDQKNKGKQSTGDAAAAELGTLKIEVPHWSAQVKILDDLLNPVAPFEKIEADPKSRSGYSTEKNLLPGAYQIQITLEGKTESEWVPVRPNRLTKVTTDAWSELEFTSAAPIKQIKNSTTSQVNAVEKTSRRLTWKDSKGDSRLFLFIRTVKPEKYGESFSGGLKLYDENQNLITDFSKDVELNKKQGWMAFNANLPAGGYILKRGRRGTMLRNQVIYLCPKWQTEVFLRASKYPALGTMNVNMKNIRHDSSSPNSTEAAEAVINYLRYKTNIQVLLENSRLSEDLNILLHGKIQNPWLGILAAHAILKMEEEIKTRNVHLDENQKTDFNEYSRLLRRKLIPFLKSEIPTHPDVRILLVWQELNSDSPNTANIESGSFPFPPMLWLSFKRICAYSTQCANLIPADSLTDCIIDKPLDDSPWTAWSHLDRYPQNPGDAESAGGKGSITGNSNKIFSVKAEPPPYRNINLALQSYVTETPEIVSDDVINITSDQKALQQISVLQTTRNLVSDYVETGRIEEMPEEYLFNSSTQIELMLEKVDPQTVSSDFNIPLSRVESSLETLKEQGRSLVEAGRQSFSNVGAGRQKSVVQTQQGQAIISSAVNPAPQQPMQSDAAESDEVSATGNLSIRIEYIFNQLNVCAARLWTIGKNPVSKDEDRPASFTEKEIRFAGQCASKLSKYAERALQQADFIVNTDQYDQIFEFNEAFRYLLFPAVSEPLSPEQALEEFSRRQTVWKKELAALPVGHSLMKDPVQKKNKRRFSVRRLMIKDEQTGLQSYLNIIQDQNAEKISSENLEVAAGMLADLTLYTSLFAYGTADDKKECVRKLNKLTLDLRTLIFKNE